MSGSRILSVGQCGADNWSISRTFKDHFQAQVTPADSFDEAVEKLRHETFDLVLVNRITDGDGTPGVGLIRRIKRDPALAKLPVMLVSNYDDAQTEAVAAGAVPGFGKGALGHPAMLARVKAVLGPDAGEAERKG